MLAISADNGGVRVITIYYNFIHFYDVIINYSRKISVDTRAAICDIEYCNIIESKMQFKNI